MKKFLFVAAAMLSMSLQAHAGSESSIDAHDMFCEVKLVDGTIAKASIFVGGLGIHKAIVNGTKLTLRHGSDLLTVAAIKGDSAQVITAGTKNVDVINRESNGLVVHCSRY